jgi:F0F1-type ATP synthase assembly protein I
MPDDQFDKRYSKAMALTGVGTEMVAPIAIGYLLDYWMGTLPWCMVVGAVLGFIIGIYHLAQFNRQNK